MIFDTHAHYDDDAFDEDRDTLLGEIFSSGICCITDVGASVKSSKSAVALSKKWPQIYAAVGVHPDSTADMTEEDIETLRSLAQEKKVVAIGEIGLDYYWDNSPREVQKKWFERQLALAREVDLPVIIHSREAAKDTMDIMREAAKAGNTGVIHCYSYAAPMAKEYISMGFFIGIGGVLTFKNARVIKEVASEIPLSSIVLETDSPYLAPVPYRGKRNNSMYLKEVVNPKNTIEVLQKYQFHFAKKFGQNFLIDTHVLDKIVRAAEITPEDYVLEIGPGIGTLTQYLCESAKHVFAVEIDDNLIPILQDTLSAYDNVTVIHNDVLKLDINKLVEEKCEGKRIKVVANLPYYITTPILMGLFESHVPMESVTVMVQKEVAQRMQALPGGKDYGALSLAVQFYAEPYIVANVPPNCFMPRPNVGSAVIRLTSHKKPVAVKNEKLMFDIIRASFNQRRKTLVNGLYNVGGLNKSKEELAAVLESIGLAANVRGETLTLEQFAALSDALSKSAQ